MDTNANFSDETLATKPSALASGLYQDQVVLISGGGSGIGRVTAWLAARLGAQVLIFGRKLDKVESVAEAIRARGFHCEAGALDIRNRDGVDAVMAKVFQQHGRLDLLFNNAGGHFPSPAIDISERGWKAVIDNNLNGTFNMMQSAARCWRDAGSGGSILNMSLSTRAANNLGHSIASRAGIVAFSERCAVEWAQYGIRINCIAPGAVATEIWRDEERALYAEANLLRRVSSSWEIAEASLFLGSSAAGFINGQVLVIDGGAALWGEAWPCGKPEYLSAATRVWDQQADLLGRWRR